MTLLVIGLDGLSPRTMLTDPVLDPLAHLVQVGGSGPLEATPPGQPMITWASILSALDPGSLGLYADVQRPVRDRYEAEVAGFASSPLSPLPYLWDALEATGRKMLLAGTPAWFDRLPASVALERIPSPMNADPGDGIDTRSLEVFLDRFGGDPEIAVAGLIDDTPSRLGWKEPEDFRAEWIASWSEALENILGRLDGSDTVAILSSRQVGAAQHRFDVSQWLEAQGDLVREQGVVDWTRTRAVAETDPVGGARIYLNVRGRDRCGVLDESEAMAFRESLAERLKQASEHKGIPGGVEIHRPERLYVALRGVAPDLILDGRSAKVTFCPDEVEANPLGHPVQGGAYLLVRAGDTSLATDRPSRDIDIGRSLFSLAGVAPPDEAMGSDLSQPVGGDQEAREIMDEEAIIRERLSGLGYL